MMHKFSRAQIAWRLAQDIKDGDYVNLGIGMPELVVNYIPEGREIVFHSENGILGMGPEPHVNKIDYDLINAGKKPVTILPGGAIFHHGDSFGMIRGGHIDVCVMGAFQVSADGDLANWFASGSDAVPAVGGAMDLALGARKVLVMTDHNTKKGDFKIVDRCTYPLTGLRVVSSVYTDIAVIDIEAGGPIVREKIAAVSFDELQDRTGTSLRGKSTCAEMLAPNLG